MIERSLVILCCLVLLNGCAGGPPVSQLGNVELCRDATIGRLVGKDRESRTEILKRGLIQDFEWEAMVDRRVQIGMSECAALAATSGYGGPFRGVEKPYQFGSDNTLIIEAFDPREPPASYTNHMKSRASETCYTPYACQRLPVERVQQKYVPKYLLTFKNGKVTACKSVDLSKVGITSDNAQLFTLPCMKDVPGFKN